jgi:hypothetical protein
MRGPNFLFWTNLAQKGMNLFAPRNITVTYFPGTAVAQHRPKITQFEE